MGIEILSTKELILGQKDENLNFTLDPKQLSKLKQKKAKGCYFYY
jgi:hypothetical protein